MIRVEPPVGLRFVHPDLDEGREAGLLCGADGRPERVTGAALVRQSLLLLLSTLPGERVMRPEYGCELLTLAFSPNDDTTAGLAMHYVREAITRSEPRVRILNVTATRLPEAPNVLQIRLDYQPDWGFPDSLTVGLPLDAPSVEV